MEPDELTLNQASELLGIGRPRLSQLAQTDALPSRMEIGPDGKVRRLVKRADVEALLKQRQEEAEAQTGKGRPIKVPRKGVGMLSKQEVLEQLRARFAGIPAVDYCREMEGSSSSDGGRDYLARLHNRPHQPETFHIIRLPRDGQGIMGSEVDEVPNDVEWQRIGG